MDVGIPSAQAILILSFNIFRVLCRRYGAYLIFGVIIVVFQGFSGYYILYYGIDDDLEVNKPIKIDGRSLNSRIKYDKKSSHDWTKDNYPDKSKKNHETQIPVNVEIIYNKDPEEELNYDHYDFGFTLPCKINNKEAISALQRAKTLNCRKKIANISCEVMKGTFYPTRLISFCPTYGHIRGRAMGCFKDNVTNRVLGDYMVTLKKNSPSLCADTCFQRGFVYSGVEYSKECFCGNADLSSKVRVSDTDCNMKCSGSLKMDSFCGGLFRVSIVETGLAKTPLKPLRKAVEASVPLVRIAYILTVNGRSLKQVLRLFKILFHKDHFFFIHVDSRQQYLYRELLRLEATFSNVVLSRKRFSSIWGGSSLLKVLLHSMKELLLKKEWNWDFVINLSESDFPIKTNDALVTFLTANRERNFLKSHGHDTNKFLQKQGLDRTFFECENHMWRLGERKLPLGIRIDGGSDWIGLNRQFVEYITLSNDLLVDGLKKVFSHTLLPGESFFHTVLRNSEYCQTFTDNNLHVTNWKRKLGCRCQYKHIVDWCGCSPNDFTLQDWGKLEASRHKNLFFGRKFEAVKSLEAINKVDEWLYGNYNPNTLNLRSFWDNIFHYEDPPSGKEDVTLTLMHSATRLTAALIKTLKRKTVNSQNCDVAPVLPIQAHSYFVEDHLEGILVEFLARTKMGTSLKFESFLQPKTTFKVISNTDLAQRLIKMEVNTNFDLKEQMFRNFGGYLGPESEIWIAFWLSPNDGLHKQNTKTEESDDGVNVETILVDPLDAVVAHASLVLDKDELVYTHTFIMNAPLRPGVWKAYLIEGSHLLASLKFPILPMQFVQGRQISITEGKKLHGGPKKPYSDLNDEVFELLKNLEGQLTLPMEYPGNASIVKSADEKAFQFGPQLSKWIDEIVDRFYKIQGLCHLSDDVLPPCLQDIFPLCSDAQWSSHSRDPKSELGPIDSQTGRLADPFRMPKDS